MQRKKYIISCFLVILLGCFTAFISSRFLGNWAFIILTIVYYTYIACFVHLEGVGKLKTMYAKPKLEVGPITMAIVASILPLFVFITNINLLSHPYMIMWLIFGLVNPFFEETFWRGYIIDGLNVPVPVAILFSTIMFTLSHPLMWGMFSHTLREPAMIISLLIMGCLWGTIYVKTKNLWLCVISHMFVDFFNMSIFSFLDMIILGKR